MSNFFFHNCDFESWIVILLPSPTILDCLSVLLPSLSIILCFSSLSCLSPLERGMATMERKRTTEGKAVQILCYLRCLPQLIYPCPGSRWQRKRPVQFWFHAIRTSLGRTDVLLFSSFSARRRAMIPAEKERAKLWRVRSLLGQYFPSLDELLIAGVQVTE